MKGEVESFGFKMESQPMPDVLTVIVTFNGGATIADTLRAAHVAAGRHGPIVVMDNASSDTTRDIVRELALTSVQIQPQSTNVGVAAAYNMALAQARRLGARWLFLLDQDSRCAVDCLEQLLAGAAALPHPSSTIGALCPTVINAQFPEIIHYPWYWQEDRFQAVASDLPTTSKPLPVDSTITSGTLYAVASLTAVQGFREQYFIDFVDHECHLRLRQKGFQIYWAPRARLWHRLGCRQVMTPKGLWIEHPPRRYYYMMRNMLEGYARLGGWRALGCFSVEVLRHCGRISRQGQAPVRTLGFILKGVWHALCGKSGALDAF